MRRVFQAVTLMVCLAVAIGAPRGLLLAALAAGIGIARNVYAEQDGSTGSEPVSNGRGASKEQPGPRAAAPEQAAIEASPAGP